MMSLNFPTISGVQTMSVISAGDIFCALGLGSRADFDAQLESYLTKNALPPEQEYDEEYKAAYGVMSAIRVVVWALGERAARGHVGATGEEKLSVVVDAVSGVDASTSTDFITAASSGAIN